ncbi:MAG: hypothetical protein ACK559_00395, partial [bacterium]
MRSPGRRGLHGSRGAPHPRLPRRAPPLCRAAPAGAAPSRPRGRPAGDRMSFWARLFGTDPASRLRKAEKAIARKAWFEAWEELDGLEVAEAAPLREAAARGLVVLNLAEAEARLRSGDGRGAQESLDLARQFGATDSDFHAVRRAAREVRV